jgi:hypothetical protein
MGSWNQNLTPWMPAVLTLERDYGTMRQKHASLVAALEQPIAFKPLDILETMRDLRRWRIGLQRTVESLQRNGVKYPAGFVRPECMAQVALANVKVDATKAHGEAFTAIYAEFGVVTTTWQELARTWMEAQPPAVLPDSYLRLVGFNESFQTLVSREWRVMERRIRETFRVELDELARSLKSA